MARKSEQALNAFLALLETIALVPKPKIERNTEKPDRVPAAGLIILRDGDPGDPDGDLGGGNWVWEARPEVEFSVKGISAAERDEQMDGMLAAFGILIESDPTLGGLVEVMEPEGPLIDADEDEGATTIKEVVIPVRLEYETNSPLG